MATAKVERSETVITLTLNEKEAQILVLLTGKCNGARNDTGSIYEELKKSLASVNLKTADSGIGTIDLYRHPPKFNREG